MKQEQQTQNNQDTKRLETTAKKLKKQKVRQM